MSPVLAVHAGGADFNFVVAKLYAIFQKQGVVPPEDAFTSQIPMPARPVGLIFGRPTCKVFEDELLPDSSYYNLRSGANIELFYMGFEQRGEEHQHHGELDNDV